MSRLGFLLILSLSMSPGLAIGATYYVAKTGSDSNSCVQATVAGTPKLTIMAGLDCLAASDTLLIKAGTYAEGISRLAIPSGTAGAPTTVSGFSTDVVTVRPASDAGGGAWVIGDSRGYITLKNMIIDGVNVNSGSSSIRLLESVSYITFDSLEVKNGPASGVMITGTNDFLVNHIIFRNVTSHDNGVDDHHHGFYLRGTDHIIENSHSYNNAGYGVHVYSGSTNTNHRITMRNNRIHDNGATGILIGRGNDHVVYNNLVWNNGYTFGGRGIHIYSGTANNNQVYNNTVYNNNGRCIDITSASTNGIAKNNICWQNAVNSVTDAGTGSTISNNLTTADPRFYNLASLDFRLTEGSPAIDKGAIVPMVQTDYLRIRRPQGFSYDIGAYEFTSGTDNDSPLTPTNLRVQ